MTIELYHLFPFSSGPKQIKHTFSLTALLLTRVCQPLTIGCTVSTQCASNVLAIDNTIQLEVDDCSKCLHGKLCVCVFPLPACWLIPLIYGALLVIKVFLSVGFCANDVRTNTESAMHSVLFPSCFLLPGLSTNHVQHISPNDLPAPTCCSPKTLGRETLSALLFTESVEPSSRWTAGAHRM